jgi:hypothetical protein
MLNANFLLGIHINLGNLKLIGIQVLAGLGSGQANILIFNE